MDAWFLRYGKNNLCPLHFESPIGKKKFPLVLQDNRKMNGKGLGMTGHFMEMDVGDGLACPWSCWRNWSKFDFLRLGFFNQIFFFWC